MPAPGPAASSDPVDDRCDVCGTPLVVGQEWCLECGASRTLIHPPPDWRTGIAIVVIVVALALAAVGYALTRLTAGRPAPAVVTQVRTVRVPSSTHGGANRTQRRRTSVGYGGTP